MFNTKIDFLKPKQEEGLKTVLNAVRDDSFDIIFLLLRTGYGKTLIGTS